VPGVPGGRRGANPDPGDLPPDVPIRHGEQGTAISGISRDSRNNIYAIGHDDGTIYRIEHAELKAAPTSTLPRQAGSARMRVDLAAGRLVWTDPAGRTRILRPDGRTHGDPEIP
jgi:hypothetical protein